MIAIRKSRYIPTIPTSLRRWCSSIPVCPPSSRKTGADDRPVYAGDIARAVEICCRDDRQVIDAVGGKIIEAGGPDGECFPTSAFLGGNQ